ncbi:hypothetical protein M409DRAFT_30086 [Zasmidium cellare ATCC 36951]|uniref:Xylanolytic transcriptional activator regulatory domain-containing protein n=1 Tax=Zasmidium cellare ATCC 36951 TaxID=1080233 RepID=A0A6A6C176_ZASCE|nr:uncharacterized protein M409DRAFT_30086 [Zasmidium cellare ATCC 36951]KAF2159466.1 hypothetical protein M409DRAFT_30086 [Zasmidium cellare ATCC 36951]
MAPQFEASSSLSLPPDIFNAMPELDWFSDTTDIFGLDFTPTIDNAIERQLNGSFPAEDCQNIAAEHDGTCDKHVNDSAKQRHAIFQRSLWLWRPDANQNAFSEHNNIPMNERSIDMGASPHQPYLPSLHMEDTLSQDSRDRILQLVVKTAKSHVSIPSFPSTACLDTLLKVGIAKRLETDAWIHPYTFDSEKTRPELLTALIAAGCVCFGIPRVSKTGLVLFEIVRVALNQLAEEDNSVIRDLQYLQACMIWIDVTAFCGFQRKMQIAESSLQPLVTALRRTGKFDHVSYTKTRPCASDQGDELEDKWRRWVEDESYKRLVHHIFEHDIYTTIAKERQPLISYAELSVPLPAARDLWLAPSADIWQLVYDTKRFPSPTSDTISLRDLLANPEMVHCLSDLVDLRIVRTAHLSGLAAQCWDYFQQAKVTSSVFTSSEDPSTKLWMQSRHQKLYQSLQSAKRTTHTDVAVTELFAELLMMSLHVSLDEITRFAGKCGEAEAHRAYQTLQPWSQTKQARIAVWHAGQVIHFARNVLPYQLRGADGLMVYHAVMVLWAYGMMQRDAARRKADGKEPRESTTSSEPSTFLDDMTNDRTNDFLLMNTGRPCLRFSNTESGTESQACDIRNAQGVMAVGIAVLEGNLPNEIRENLPQLTRSLCELMKALGSLK